MTSKTDAAPPADPRAEREAGHERDGHRTGYGSMVQNYERHGAGAAAQSSAGAGPARADAERPRCARDVMKREPPSVRDTDPLQRVAQAMGERESWATFVVDERGTLRGVLTGHDIVRRLVAAGVETKGATARDAMTLQVAYVAERDGLDTVLQRMAARRVHRVAVVSPEHRLVGVVTMADLADAAEDHEELKRAIEQVFAEGAF